ncbi:AMP-binding protein [Allohahella marinimesophila]|uniref:3,4-dihydroxybenzoic acid-AMP ligase AsbC n=1 Tax=Allohahella marinimesophila TaxID=1054972 RepID=A0ABP7NX81_9GAMM
MFHVNDTFFNADDLQRYFRHFEAVPGLRGCHGQRYAICLADAAEWLALCLYLRANGGSVMPLHPATPLKAALRQARRGNCHQLLFHSLEEPISLTLRSGDTEAVLVQMSSGTTGEPKCIERSWRSIDREVRAYIQHFPIAQTMQPVIACPVTHAYGLICGVLVALQRELMPIIVTNINPKYTLKKMAEHPQSLLYSSPVLINTLLKLLPPGQRLHAVMTSGAVMPAPCFDLLRQKADHCFQQYGCSEAGCIAINQDMQAANELGKPLPHLQVRAGRKPGTPGEIQVKSGGRIINTRDFGVFDESGNLSFLARLDDTIIVGGINVYPQEVEDVFLQRPEITDAVVFKRPDEYAGERVCLKFVARIPLEISRLRSWSTAHLSPHQVPMDISQVDDIPRLDNGKINRRQLIEEPQALSA